MSSIIVAREPYTNGYFADAEMNTENKMLTATIAKEEKAAPGTVL